MSDKYYNEIKNRLIDVEVTNRVKDYSKTKTTLENYYEIGRLIIEAQGGEKRNKYGDNLIKEYAIKLTSDLGKGYSWRNLYNMRLYYLTFSNNSILQPLAAKLSWTHYTILLTLKNPNEIRYYINLCIKLNLGKRELQSRIKLKEYEKLPNKIKLKLIENKKLEITETIKEPIIILNPNNIEVIKEKTIQGLIMEKIYNFLKQLGPNYMFVGNEYPIKVGNRHYKIDLLLYNVDYESYVVVELKVDELKYKDIGQINFYINYVDKNIKKITQNKTIGIILCHRNNKLILEYCTDPRILVREYVLV